MSLVSPADFSSATVAAILTAGLFFSASAMLSSREISGAAAIAAAETAMIPPASADTAASRIAFRLSVMPLPP